MSYVIAIPGIIERLASVPGLAKVDNVPKVEAGEPKQVDVTPMLYFLYHAGSTIETAGPKGSKYDVMIRALVRWEDNDNAEYDIAPFVDAVPKAFNARDKDTNGHTFATLGGRVNTCEIITIQSGEQAGFHVIKDISYRSVTWILRITDKKSEA